MGRPERTRARVRARARARGRTVARGDRSNWEGGRGGSSQLARPDPGRNKKTSTYSSQNKTESRLTKTKTKQ